VAIAIGSGFIERVDALSASGIGNRRFVPHLGQAICLPASFAGYFNLFPQPEQRTEGVSSGFVATILNFPVNARSVVDRPFMDRYPLRIDRTNIVVFHSAKVALIRGAKGDIAKLAFDCLSNLL